MSHNTRATLFHQLDTKVEALTNQVESLSVQVQNLGNGAKETREVETFAKLIIATGLTQDNEPKNSLESVSIDR